MKKNRIDRMNVGDMVTWTSSRGHAYFVGPKHHGVLLKKLEQYEHWVCCDVLNEQGKIDRVMLYKEENPL